MRENESMTQAFFEGVERVRYEGPETQNPPFVFFRGAAGGEREYRDGFVLRRCIDG